MCVCPVQTNPKLVRLGRKWLPVTREQLTELFNRNVIPPFLPIIDWQEMKFFKDGRMWFKRNKIDLI